MKISRLSIEGFRNLRPVLVDLSPNINCIFGENAQGKTNLLEAIYFLIEKKTFRKNASFPQFLPIDCEQIQINMGAQLKADHDELFSLTRVLTPETVRTNLTPDHGNIPRALFLSPVEYASFYDQTQIRRLWFQKALGMISPQYKRAWSAYGRFRKQKSALLQQGNKDRALMGSLHKEMAKYTLILSQERETLSPLVERSMNQNFQDLFGVEFELGLSWEVFASAGLPLEQVLMKFDSSLSEEFQRRQVLVGPHKDVGYLTINSLQCSDYASVGQQKVAYMALHFALVDLVADAHSGGCILLLDDISGELDSLRWKNLIEYLTSRNVQVIMTSANEAFQHELASRLPALRLKVSAGEVQVLGRTQREQYDAGNSIHL